MVSACRVLRFRALLVAAALLAGCREAESISTYETPRTEPRAEPYDMAQLRAGLDHMLVAVVPQGDAAWFFKLVARGDAVEELRQPFEQFISSVELKAKGETPGWTLPEGWTEKAGGEMRVATIDVPVKGATVELAVSTLPLSGDWDGYLTSNVNRWMGQLQQGELPAKTVAELARSLPVKGGEATVLELAGVMARPAGGMPAGHPVVDGGVAKPQAAGDAEPQAVEGARPRAGGAPMGGAVAAAAEFAKPAEFTYEPPTGWQPGATSSMRKAAFIVAEGEARAEVTVMPFPANAAMSDPLAQAARWAGQAGLEKSEAELKALAKDVTISESPGQQFTLLGEGEPPVGILAAMVPQGEQVWFFKMTGDRALVEKQGEAFAKFLASVKFAK